MTDRQSAYRVTFNTHRYADLSDSPHKGTATVRAADADTAREIVRERGTRSRVRPYIGLVFRAVEVAR